jgi:hypothetical protein
MLAIIGLLIFAVTFSWSCYGIFQEGIPDSVSSWLGAIFFLCLIPLGAGFIGYSFLRWVYSLTYRSYVETWAAILRDSAATPPPPPSL